MEQNLSFLTPFITCLLIYLISTFLYHIAFIFNKKTYAIPAIYATLLGFLVHSIVLGFELFHQGYPFVMSYFHITQLASWASLTTFLVFSRVYQIHLAGAVFMPIVLILYLMSLTRLITLNTPMEILMNPWATIHIAFMSLSLGVFFISLITASTYLYSDYAYKNKKFYTWLEKLPSLELIDKIHFRGMYVGFIFFTLGIITGAGWSKSIVGHYITEDPKQIFAMLIWLFFALFLNFRTQKGWIGYKGVILSLVGILGVILLFTWVDTF